MQHIFNRSTSKQLQNNIVDLFCSQQKSLTSANRKTQYMFSSLDALMLNSHANAHNDKNTINLWNANSQQKEQTWVIVKFKEMKKRKAMKSLQKEASIEVSTRKCYDVISKKMQIKRLRERIEFAVNQLRQAISEQKETINHNLIYIWRFLFYFYFFIKCMQSMTMTLSRHYVFAKLHVI